MNAIEQIRSMAAMTIKDIPPEILASFKAWCSMHQKTVKQGIIDLMKEKGDTVRIEKK